MGIFGIFLKREAEGSEVESSNWKSLGTFVLTSSLGDGETTTIFLSRRHSTMQVHSVWFK